MGSFPLYCQQRQHDGDRPAAQVCSDMFKLAGLDYYLIPQGACNQRREKYWRERLPIYYAQPTAAARSRPGRRPETRGLISQQQFNKVELVKFMA